MMHEPEKSDSVVVAAKPTNKVERSAAEPVEPRTETKGNVGQQSTRRAQDRDSVSQALERVRQAAAGGLLNAIQENGVPKQHPYILPFFLPRDFRAARSSIT